MNSQHFNYQDLKNLWLYHENLQKILAESKTAEFPEIPVVHFCENGGLQEMSTFILPALKLPHEATSILTEAIVRLKSLASKGSPQLITEAFDTYQDLVQLVAQSLCNSARPV